MSSKLYMFYGAHEILVHILSSAAVMSTTANDFFGAVVGNAHMEGVVLRSARGAKATL